MAPNSLPPLAGVEHASGNCRPGCGEDAWETGRSWFERGGLLIGADAVLRVAPVILDHRYQGAGKAVAEAISQCTELNTLRFHRYWLRRLTPFMNRLAPRFDVGQWVALVAADSAFWSPHAISLGLRSAGDSDRQDILRAIERHSEPSIIPVLVGEGSSPDIADLRARLVTRHAPRLFANSFGKLLVHKGGWTGQQIEIAKKRERQFLSFLIAHCDDAISRDQVLDALWPDASPGAAVNNLNQTVFQLRRVFDPDYRDGMSPAYILSSLDGVSLNPDLVRVDWTDLQRRFSKLVGGDAPRDETLEFALSVLRGQFLQESMYDDWSHAPRQRVHQFLRGALLPLVTSPSIPASTRVRIGTAVVALDDFDELAHIALGRALAESGRRMAGLNLIRRLAARLEDELSEPPPENLVNAISELRQKSTVT